jgi:Leucine-rich repeat (LRR) protein
MKLYKNLNTALKEREEVRALKLTLKGGQFPEELFDFPHLSELYLEGETEYLPARFDAWKELRTLSLRWPQFSGDISQLFSLPQLENLKVMETPVKTLRLPVGQVVAPLKVLTMKKCQLTQLPEDISMLSKLTEFFLPNNHLKNLPVTFSELSLLKRLNLDQNNFSLFPDVFKEMPHLSHLSIDGNAFPEEEKERIQRLYGIWIH